MLMSPFLFVFMLTVVGAANHISLQGRKELESLGHGEVASFWNPTRYLGEPEGLNEILTAGKVDDSQGIALLKAVAQRLQKIGTKASASELLKAASNDSAGNTTQATPSESTPPSGPPGKALSDEAMKRKKKPAGGGGDSAGNTTQATLSASTPPSGPPGKALSDKATKRKGNALPGKATKRKKKPAGGGASGGKASPAEVYASGPACANQKAPNVHFKALRIPKWPANMEEAMELEDAMELGEDNTSRKKKSKKKKSKKKSPVAMTGVPSSSKAKKSKKSKSPLSTSKSKDCWEYVDPHLNIKDTGDRKAAEKQWNSGKPAEKQWKDTPGCTFKQYMDWAGKEVVNCQGLFKARAWLPRVLSTEAKLEFGKKRKDKGLCKARTDPPFIASLEQWIQLDLAADWQSAFGSVSSTAVLRDLKRMKLDKNPQEMKKATDRIEERYRDLRELKQSLELSSRGYLRQVCFSEKPPSWEEVQKVLPPGESLGEKWKGWYADCSKFSNAWQCSRLLGEGKAGFVCEQKSAEKTTICKALLVDAPDTQQVSDFIASAPKRENEYDAVKSARNDLVDNNPHTPFGDSKRAAVYPIYPAKLAALPLVKEVHCEGDDCKTGKYSVRRACTCSRLDAESADCKKLQKRRPATRLIKHF